MANAARRRRSGRTPLSRERVLRAAFELADEGGLEAVTMQSIGQRLGVEAMSLYRHVQNKEDVLNGLVDLVLSGIDLPSREPGWKEAMRRRAISARLAFARHGWAIGLVQSRTAPGPATLRHHEEVLSVLLDAGFSGVMAAHTYNLLDSYIYGFAMQEETLPGESQRDHAEIGQRLAETLPADEYPSMVRVALDFVEAGADYGAEFEFGLDLILDGIERAQAQGNLRPGEPGPGDPTRAP